MIHPVNANRLSSEDKLAALRRLDERGPWHSLDDRRCCTICHNTITGWQIEVVGGTRGLGPLRLQCPTPNCRSEPAHWQAEAACKGAEEKEFTFLDSHIEDGADMHLAKEAAGVLSMKAGISVWDT